MYRILIVDDEAIEREVVLFLLKQNNFPLDIQEASNGKIALEHLSKTKFDILFTDIRMPYIDGLTLAKKARELHPDIQIVFFSGYDDFSYVKEALLLNVLNYILKPINPEEFKKTISDVLEQIRNREEITQKIKVTQDFLQNHILYKLLNQTDIKHLKELYPELDLSFLYHFHRLFLIQLERDYSNIFLPDIQHLLPEETFFINLNPSQNILLFSGQIHHPQWYQDLANRLSSQIEEACCRKCFIAISTSFSDPAGISKAYEDAEKHLIERFFFTTQSLFGEELPSVLTCNSSPDNIEAILEKLQTDIQYRDACGLRKNMTLLTNSFQSQSNISHMYYRYLCTNVLKLLLDNLPQEKEKSFDEYTKTIYYSNNLYEIKSILLGLTEKVASEMEKEQLSSKHVLNQVKHYILNHYMEELSLDILAKEVYITPRYLSTLFIEETGFGINKYIKKIRMEKAKELLLGTNLKINEICNLVGYSNLSYFCKSFAEEFGKTPNHFRQTAIQKGIDTE